MGDVVVREEPALDEDTLDALTAGYAYDDYRRVRTLPAEGALAHFRARLQAAAERPRTAVLVARDRASDTPAGLALLQRLPQDSELFGREIAGVPSLLARADHPQPRAVFAALVGPLAAVCERERYTHVSARTDTENLPAYHALADAGFRLIETLVTLSYDTERRGTGVVDPAQFGFDGVVRRAGSADGDALGELAAKRFRMNRYHRDESLPTERADALMARWIRSYCEDPEDHGVWVAEGTGGRLAGFLGHALDRDLERASGVLVSGRALLAVEDPRAGVGQMLSRAHTWQSRGAYKECDTQLDNYGMLKAAFNLDMDLVRTRYTFHRSFD